MKTRFRDFVVCHDGVLWLQLSHPSCALTLHCPLSAWTSRSVATAHHRYNIQLQQIFTEIACHSNVFTSAWLFTWVYITHYNCYQSSLQIYFRK